MTQLLTNHSSLPLVATSFRGHLTQSKCCSCANDLRLSAPRTLHTPVLIGVTPELPKADWVLGVTHSNSVVNTANRRKRLGLFLPAFCSDFPGVLAPHKPTSGISGKWWPVQERPVSEPWREGGRKERRRKVGVSICHQMQVSPVSSSYPAALGDGFFRRLTWASCGLPLLPRPCFNSWLSPVINYSSVWPDLVSNNSSYFEMHGGALFGFSLLFADLRGNGSSVFCGETSISLQPPFPQLHITTLLVRFLNKAFC